MYDIKFKPKANSCSKCRKAEELAPEDSNVISCSIFPWLIDRELSKKQAVCKE